MMLPRSLGPSFGVIAMWAACTLPACAAEPPTSSQHSAGTDSCLWVREASVLVKELRAIARDTPHIGRDAPGDALSTLRAIAAHSTALRDSAEEGEQRIWRLWLTTGHPPKAQAAGKCLRAFLEEHASLYEQFISEHCHLSDEEIARLGLRAAVDSLGSPLWYATIQFLEQKLGCTLRDGFVLCVTPPRIIVWHPLPSDSYARLSCALTHWLDNNERIMLWEPQERRFRPGRGAYIGTTELATAIESEFARVEFGEEEMTKGERAPTLQMRTPRSTAWETPSADFHQRPGCPQAFQLLQGCGR